MSLFGNQTNSNGGFVAPAPDAAPFVFGGRSDGGSSGGTDRQAPPPPNSTALPNPPPPPVFVFGSTNSAAAPSSMPQPSSGFVIDAPSGTFGGASMSATPLFNVSGSASGGKFGASSSLFPQSSSGPSTTVGLGTNSAIAPALGSLFGSSAVATPFGNATSSSVSSDTRVPLANLPQPALVASQGLFGPAGSSSNIPFSSPFEVNQQQPGVSSSMSSPLWTKVYASPAQPGGGWTPFGNPTSSSDGAVSNDTGVPMTNLPQPALAASQGLFGPAGNSSNIPFSNPFAVDQQQAGVSSSMSSSLWTTVTPPPPAPSSVFVFGRTTLIAPTGDGSARPATAPDPAAAAATAQANNEELQKLKERLEAKKKKVARMREAMAATTAPGTVQADTPFLVPSSAATAKDETVSTSCPPDQESLTQGNTIHFTTNPLLPYSAKAAMSSTSLHDFGGSLEQEDLENAGPLVGTCEQMCPKAEKREEKCRHEKERQQKAVEEEQNEMPARQAVDIEQKEKEREELSRLAEAGLWSEQQPRAAWLSHVRCKSDDLNVMGDNDSGTLLVDLAPDDADLTTTIRRDLRDKLAEAQATLTELVALLALDEAIEFDQPRGRELLEQVRRQLSDVADKWEVDRKREETHQVDLEPTQTVEEEALTLDADPQQLHDRLSEKPQRQERETPEKDRVEQEHQAQMEEMEQARMVAWLW